MDQRTARVNVFASTPYEVTVGEDLDFAAEVSRVLDPSSAAILTDSTVGPLYAAKVKHSLGQAGWDVLDTVEVPAGELSKSVGTYAHVLRRLASEGLPRDGALFALGGGVVGDLGGFVAASYMRGIDFVQFPTSLLAMVDSSVGGKVGIDLPEGKNLVGAFLQPRAVLANLDWLATLPEREVSCGLAEVVKMGLLAGGEFYRNLDRVADARAGDVDVLRTLVVHSIRMKAGVVANDERESGRRSILNYGHTIGHGLEAAAGYGLAHGEAISAGMLAAARLSRERFGTDLLKEHERPIRDAGLPERIPSLDVEKAILAMGRDKKRRASDRAEEYRFVLLEEIGRPLWGIPVSGEEARRVMEEVID